MLNRLTVLLRAPRSGLRGLLPVLLLFSPLPFVSAQGPSATPERSTFKDPTTALWINTYGNVRLTDRFFWIAQTHFRFAETPERPFAGQIAQLYNRHAISYLYSKKFQASLGGVLRLNFNTGEVGEADRDLVPEWRIWHEYLFAVPFERIIVYHRIRVEHRWTKGFSPSSEYIFRNRWRYMASVKIPINKPKLKPHAFYIAPEAELIMQSGKPVAGSPLEDLRLHTSLGYIVTPRLTVATGAMLSFGQELNDPTVFKQKWTWRMHCYFAPDWRKIKHKLPDIHRLE